MISKLRNLFLFLNVLIIPVLSFEVELEDDNNMLPEFFDEISNQTISIGRDAIFTCSILNLGVYKVGWIKTDNKAIQAIHDHVITHNPRIFVSHNGNTVWNLHIKAVEGEDRGFYMCQINTDPMKSETAYLDVVIPPDIINDETSNDIMVQEGASVNLVCKATGFPKPIITWHKDLDDITVNPDKFEETENEAVFEGEVLKLSKINRNEMGSYVCVASNGVPPTVSKRITVSVHFHPVIQVPNQLVGAPPGTKVYLECYVESYPKPIVFWMKNSGAMVVTNDKYEVKATEKSQFQTHLSLLIKQFDASDAGSYKCNAKNSVGEVESSIRLYEIPETTKWPQQLGDEILKEEKMISNINSMKSKNEEVYNFKQEIFLKQDSTTEEPNLVTKVIFEIGDYNETISSKLNNAVLPFCNFRQIFLINFLLIFIYLIY